MQSNGANENILDANEGGLGDNGEHIDDGSYVHLQNIIKDYMIDEKHEIYFIQLTNEGVRL